ncbi:hypothetical protein AgCh_031182 [Apium graveolens]
MVQSKLANKLGITAHHVESKKRSSPSQNQHYKNKGAADSKKMMEKSRSMQHFDFDSSRSTPPLRSKDNHIPISGKPPASNHVTPRAGTPQKQYLKESPNYMKSTSSFEARRECSHVSSQTPHNIIIRKSMGPMKPTNSRHSSVSVHKPVDRLARTSSLKVVRTLLKTPSFKPARLLAKKYSPISLCDDFDVLKPTCSSNLKDSKTPMFLELSAGATESEGTSAMKVCPYTYCSLNGNHHAPLAPLKSFLSEKRRMLKAQKVTKLGCLSPSRTKPSRERMVKNEGTQVILAEIPPTKDMDFNSRTLTLLMHEQQTDFFVEIHRNFKDDDNSKGRIPESLSSTAPCFVIDFEGSLEQEQDHNVETGAKIHLFPKTHEDEILDCLSIHRNTEEESQQIGEYGQSDSEVFEMQLKEGHRYGPNSDVLSNLKLKVTDIHNGTNIELISNSDETTNSSYEDILGDEMRVGFYDEKSVSSCAWSDNGDSDLDVLFQNMDLKKPFFDCNKQIQGKIYYTCDGNRESVETPLGENSISHPHVEEFQATSVEKSIVQEASRGEKEGNCESVKTQVKEHSISHPLEEFQATSVEKTKVLEASEEMLEMNFQLGSDAINCTSDLEEVVFGLQGDEAAKRDHVAWMALSLIGFELDSTTANRSSDDVLSESFYAKTEFEVVDQEDHDEKISTPDARDGVEENKPLAAESFDIIRNSDSSRENEQEKPIADASEDMKRKEELLAAQHYIGNQPLELLQEMPDSIAVNKDQSKQTDVTIKSETKRSYSVETLPYESNGVENNEYPEINQDQLQTYDFKNSRISEDQMHFGPAVLQATPNQNQEANTGEGEQRTVSDAAETSITEKASAIAQIRDHISNANRISTEEMTQIAKHLSWKTGSRKTTAVLEDIRDFNPREPNYLTAEPDLEPEKVDLRHQLMDERKNSEEWMLDYALRQAVTNLAPKRKKKVSVLVEAFEKVLPTPKYETHPSHTSSAFYTSKKYSNLQMIS